VRILLVDDHPLLRRSVRLMLSNLQNIEVCGEAGDGVEAVARARELKPDVVVTPIGLHGMNGLAAAQQIRAFLPNIKLIVLSQHDIQQAREEAFKAGALEFVPKSSVWDLVPLLLKLQAAQIAPEKPDANSALA
jgi:DNA-binding NarL/FixJ family response regulator